jgi:hypothetical protein
MVPAGKPVDSRFFVRSVINFNCPPGSAGVSAAGELLGRGGAVWLANAGLFSAMVVSRWFLSEEWSSNATPETKASAAARVAQRSHVETPHRSLWS